MLDQFSFQSCQTPVEPGIFSANIQYTTQQRTPTNSHPINPNIEICFLESKVRMRHHIQRHISQSCNRVLVLPYHQKYSALSHDIYQATSNGGRVERESTTRHPSSRSCMCTRKSMILMLKYRRLSLAGYLATCSKLA